MSIPSQTLAQALADESSAKIVYPDKFSGNAQNLRSFLAQLDILFELHPTKFPNDRTKILLTGSLLKDEAAEWFYPFMENPSSFGLIVTSWNHFRAEFQSTFKNHDQAFVAATQITKLKQNQMTAMQFATKFRAYALELADWSEAALMYSFRHGLNSNIKNLLLSQTDPANLRELINLAIKCDNRIRDHELDLKFSSPQNVPLHFPSAPRSDSMDLDAIKRGPLSTQEREHRMKNGLCLVCGKKGHFKDKCFKSRNRSFNQMNIQQQQDFQESQ
jgi:hypothetical protein